MCNLFLNDTWNPWTEKSENTPFKSTENALGDGEQKLGAEYDEKPQGQNISYDLNILGEKWEVKKLDSDNSFRLGVEVASSYRIIIDKATSVLEKILEIEGDLVESKTKDIIKDCIFKLTTNSGRSRHKVIEGLKKDEVSESNLEKANDIIQEVKKLVLSESENEQVFLFSSFDGSSQKYDLLSAYQKLELENISLIEKLDKLKCDYNIYSRLVLTTKVEKDVLLFKNKSLKEQLNNLVRSVFHDVKLVLVNKDMGYKPMKDLNQIYCNRITSGNPRCKVI